MQTRPALLEKESTTHLSKRPIDSTNLYDFNEIETDNLLENRLADPGIGVNLTRREKEILNFVLAGNTNREIAQKIHRTERTVEYHRNRLMRKLDVHSAVELVKCAMAMGIA